MVRNYGVYVIEDLPDGTIETDDFVDNFFYINMLTSGVSDVGRIIVYDHIIFVFKERGGARAIVNRGGSSGLLGASGLSLQRRNRPEDHIVLGDIVIPDYNPGKIE